MYETVMFETVIFIIVMLARVECFKNTHLEQLGWEPYGIVHITSKLWHRALYTHQQRVEKYSRPGYDPSTQCLLYCIQELQQTRTYTLRTPLVRVQADTSHCQWWRRHWLHQSSRDASWLRARHAVTRLAIFQCSARFIIGL